jgi:glycosyltransferase involved in cell wall biosynthesis
MENVEIAIIIATKDRPEVLGETLQSIKRQTQPAAHIYVSVSSPRDAPKGTSAAGITVLVGPPGGSAQRNTAIRQVPLDARYIAFFDDDMELHPAYLENAVSFLEKTKMWWRFPAICLWTETSLGRRPALYSNTIGPG